MDNKIPGICFNNGVCNYCDLHDRLENEYPINLKRLKEIFKIVKKEGRGREFDCVVGVSGGCDSSYMLHLCKEYGLRPLAVTFNNSWEKVEAVYNIYTMTKKLNIPLRTYVLDAKVSHDLCLSFLKASVPEIDAPLDVAIITVLRQAAIDNKINYIFNGHSFRTEGIAPHGWYYFDGKYVADIHNKFGQRDLGNFPNLWLQRWLKTLLFYNIKEIRPLYYINYKKGDTKKLLKKTYGWKEYKHHHNENLWSTFTYNYYLPMKFDKDQRVIEYSALVRSGQMSRKRALDKMKKENIINSDIVSYVIKKLGISEKEFAKYMSLPKKSYQDYATYLTTFRTTRLFWWAMYKMGRVSKSFYIKYTKRNDN